MKNATHVEYGIYLVAVGTEMRKQNKSLLEVIAPATEEEKSRVIRSMTSQGMSSGRAPEVFDKGWTLLMSANHLTYASRGLARQADEDYDAHRIESLKTSRY